MQNLIDNYGDILLLIAQKLSYSWDVLNLMKTCKNAAKKLQTYLNTYMGVARFNIDQDDTNVSLIVLFSHSSITAAGYEGYPYKDLYVVLFEICREMDNMSFLQTMKEGKYHNKTYTYISNQYGLEWYIKATAEELKKIVTPEFFKEAKASGIKN